MDETVTLVADEDGFFPLYCGERPLVHGLDDAAVQHFVDTLDAVIECPAAPRGAADFGPNGAP